MLIVPVPEKFTRRNLPLATFALILLNCFVFFAFQVGDGPRMAAALEQYVTSGLFAIESAAYRAYRQGVDFEAVAPPDPGRLQDRQQLERLREMMQDERFQVLLRRDALITPGHAAYRDWRRLRNDYEALLAEVSVYAWGYIPAEARPWTLLTHMFLHGGLGHLLGNMVFLFLAGVILEMGCGRLWSGAAYLLGGLGAVGLYTALNAGSVTPLVGASGAISALMGALAVLYGRRRIKMFLYLGIYFHYCRVPAIWLLPPWMGLELYRLVFTQGSNVAYAAHLGGLAAGAVLGAGISRLRPRPAASAAEAPAVSPAADLVGRALEHVRRLELEAGARLLEQALGHDPQHREALTHLFNLHKHAPRGEAFHRSAARLLTRLLRDTADYPEACRVWREYLQAAGKPRLAPALCLRVAMALAATGRPEAAERLLAVLIRHRPGLPGLPAALLALANAYRRRQETARWRACLKLLTARFPASAESQAAADLITRPG